MGIIFLELIILVKFIRNIKKYHIISYKYLVLAFAIQTIIFVVYRLELWSLDRIVYFSDAENYWKYTTILISDFGKGINIVKNVTGNQIGYIIFSFFTQITSPSIWVGYNNISNILLVDLSIMTLVKMMCEQNINKKNIKFFTYFILFNPLIFYSLQRNLKDALVLFMTILIIYYSIKLMKSGRKKIYNLIIIVILTYLSSTIRPWNFLITTISLSCVGIMEWKNIKKNKLLIMAITLPLFFVVISFILNNYHSTLNLWLPIVLENSKKYGSIYLLLSPFRILLGPGPVRAILGNTYFLYTTTTGNLCTLFGNILWWVQISYLGALIIHKLFLNKYKNGLTDLNICLISVTFLYLIIYSFQYGGSVELRFRGVMYIFTSAAILSSCTIKWNNNIRILTLFCLSIIFVIGTIIGL